MPEFYSTTDGQEIAQKLSVLNMKASSAMVSIFKEPSVRAKDRGIKKFVRIGMGATVHSEFDMYYHDMYMRMNVDELFSIAFKGNSDLFVIGLRLGKVHGVKQQLIFDSNLELDFVCENPWHYVEKSEHFWTKHEHYDTRVVGLIKYGTIFFFSRHAPDWYVDLMKSGFGYPTGDQLHEKLKSGLLSRLSA